MPRVTLGLRFALLSGKANRHLSLLSISEALVLSFVHLPFLPSLRLSLSLSCYIAPLFCFPPLFPLLNDISPSSFPFTFFFCVLKQFVVTFRFVLLWKAFLLLSSPPLLLVLLISLSLSRRLVFICRLSLFALL